MLLRVMAVVQGRFDCVSKTHMLEAQWLTVVMLTGGGTSFEMCHVSLGASLRSLVLICPTHRSFSSFTSEL